ncbi:MAG: hypothetical protein ACKV2T_30680 [Kofleriaceae bacterium]
MRTRWGAAVLLVFVGCGGGTSGKEKKVCEHAAKLCDAQDDVASCTKDMPETKKALGDQYEKFLDCSLAAKSCGEVVGCAIGGLGNEALDQLDGLGKGIKKMMKDELGDLPGLDDIKKRVEEEVRSVKDQVRSEVRNAVGDDALPGACKRIEKVCAPDEPFIRKECRRLVQNLGEDKANLGELTSCIDAASNCFALKDCVEKLERKMDGF